MSNSQDGAHAWRHRAFVSYVLFMLLLFLLPVPGGQFQGAQHLDKVVHCSVFLGFALLLHLDTTSRAGATFLATLAFAVTIEVVQWLLPYRDSDWWDFVAGAAGGAIGAALVLWSGRPRRAAT